MKQHEQKIAALEWLMKKSKECRSEPFKRFTPKQVAEGIGGAYTAIGGKVANEIIAELRIRGVPSDYISEGNKRFFVLK